MRLIHNEQQLGTQFASQTCDNQRELLFLKCVNLMDEIMQTLSLHLMIYNCMHVDILCV
jgi:hypothetical protein